MASSKAAVRKLLTQTEYALYEASTPKEVKKFSEARLKLKIERTRKLRQKFRDLKKRQKGVNKRARGGTDVAQRSEDKAEIFNDILERFESSLEKLKLRPSASKKSPAMVAQQKNKNTRRQAMDKSSHERRELGKSKKRADLRIGAHVRSQTAKNQARKDSR